MKRKVMNADEEEIFRHSQYSATVIGRRNRIDSDRFAPVVSKYNDKIKIFLSVRPLNYKNEPILKGENQVEQFEVDIPLGVALNLIKELQIVTSKIVSKYNGRIGVRGNAGSPAKEFM